VKRDEAVALPKQIAESKRFDFNWISLVNGKSGCEIHIKPEQVATQRFWCRFLRIAV
jgi:hypothetical protein